MAEKPEAESLEIPDELRDKDPDDLTGDIPPDELRGKTPEELQNLTDVLEAHMRSLHQTDEGELRDKTPDEQKAFDYALKLRDKAIDRLDEHRAIAEVFRRRPKAVTQTMRRIRYGDTDGVTHVRGLSNAEARERSLRTLDSRDATAHMSDLQKAQVEKMLRRDTDIARRIIVTENEDYRDAWMKLLSNPNPMLSDEERNAVRAWEEYRAMSEVSPGSAGGYGVPVFIDPSIILTAQESGNPFLQICRQVTVSTNAWKGVSSAGVTWSFDAESTTATPNPVSDDAPTLAQPTVAVNTARGFIPYSIQVGDDYPMFADEMSRLLAEGYDELLVDKFSRGTGTNEPTGIITALDANTNVEVQVTTNNAFAVDDIYKVWKALPQKYRRRASWMSSVDVNNKVRGFGGSNVYHGYTVDLTAEAADVLLNKQWYESPYFPDYVASTTTYSNLLVVGDFNNYLIARRGGMSVELIPHLFQQQTANAGVGMPTGQRGWFGYARIGGGSVNDLGFRLLQDPTA